MKIGRLLSKIYVLAALPFCVLSSDVYAQLPNCSGADSGLIYYNVPFPNNSIYNLNPQLPISGTNPTLNSITMPTGAAGLAYCNNLNGGTPSPTFYTVVGGFFYYYDGSGWTNTGHTAGSAGAVNLGGGGNVIYNLDGSTTGDIYKYTGAGNATPLVTVPLLSGVADLAVDCSGNFYYLHSTVPQSLQKYNSSGALIASYTVTGVPPFGVGGGIAVFGNQVYFDNTSDFFSGTIVGSNINFTSVNSPNPYPADFANCAGSGSGNVQASVDTAFYCGSGPGIPVTASGIGPFTWTVLSGPAIITGAGNAITVTSSGTAKILLSSTAPTSCGGSNTDTVTIIIPTAIVDAGPAGTTFNCAGVSQPYMLSGAVTGTTTGVGYGYLWSPVSTIVSGGNTLNPVVSPASGTVYTLTVSTAVSQGGCSWSDTVSVAVLQNNNVINADFRIDLLDSCGPYRISVVNQSTYLATAPVQFHWDFGDGGTFTGAAPPVHTYAAPGTYNVQLILTDSTSCNRADTLVKTVQLNGVRVVAAFNVQDTVCGVGNVLFQNSSVNATAYLWLFGDGQSATAATPAHTYSLPGTYTITLVAYNTVSCNKVDSVKRMVTITAQPVADFVFAPSVPLPNEAIQFTNQSSAAAYYAWTFGDGSAVNTGKNPSHFYQQSGVFTVCLTAYSEAGCADSVCREVAAVTVPVADVPNAFSPNGDGHNDKLFVKGAAIAQLHFVIYNRWGQTVFETTDKTEGWNGEYNGKPAPQEGYAYMLDITFADGKTLQKKGNVTLLR